MSRPSPLATTFRLDEVRTLCAILKTLQQGGDASRLARSEPARRALAKFLRMRNKAIVQEGQQHEQQENRT